MLCCCERDEQTSSRIMSDYNIDLGEWGVSSVPALMAKIESWSKIVGTLVHNSVVFLDIQFPSSPPHLSMLCCCERDEQTSSRIMSDYNIDLGEWRVSSVPALMAKIVGIKQDYTLIYH